VQGPPKSIQNKHRVHSTYPEKLIHEQTANSTPSVFNRKWCFLLFRNPTHKTESGTANMWVLLIANHLDQSLCMFGQSKTGSSSQIILTTFFSSRSSGFSWLGTWLQSHTQSTHPSTYKGIVHTSKVQYNTKLYFFLYNKPKLLLLVGGV
jgi:hypothetical protein